jgi:hypothetical protein
LLKSKPIEKYLRTTIAVVTTSLLSNLVVYPLETVRITMSLNMRPKGAKEASHSVLATSFNLLKADR